MNFSQIKCFLAAAELRSFTHAADSLYISQPVLSRQIAAMEDELGFSLFERGKKTISLTLAGETMREGLSSLSTEYRSLVERSKALHLGFSGTLNIGMIEGQLICPPFSDALSAFRAAHPNARVNLSRHSMAGIRRAMQGGEIDVAFAARFNAEDLPDVNFIEVATAKTMLVVPKTHPLAGRENLHITDFRDDTFLTLSENELPYIAAYTSADGEAFLPKTLEAPTIGALALWLEAGFGIFPLNENHALRDNPNLRFLPIPELDENIEIVMWKGSDKNPLIPIFLDEFKKL
ncbi:MAG: LysR family transcriptional regulator [Oscillospiraceae bacterium]|jgi:DNA-binding transcriptional LysR family regulator|nr:LysR family transcriptional regulator [Oscillospiraceae bacterium]